MIRLQDSTIELPPMAVANEYIRRIGKEKNRLLILPDVDKLFGEEEMQELKERLGKLRRSAVVVEPSFFNMD